jgi:hypothetical protein
MSNYSVVITTINQPTDDVKRVVELAGRANATVFVVGDKKTPDDWDCGEAVYISYARQCELYPTLAQLLSSNHYSRKNIGYLIAARGEGDWIYETDDDNRPMSTKFNPPEKLGFMKVVNKGWVNVLPEFNERPLNKIWPRGFPLELVNNPEPITYSTDVIHQAVVMGLVDQDPDVDAIYRMTQELPYVFGSNDKIITLVDGAWCPWNSQNTWWRKECLPLMYLPTTVTPRVTDILRSYVATAILQKFGLGIGITSPTAVQVRNQHNLLKDFADEMPLYLHADQMMACIIEGIEDSDNYYTAMYDAYQNLADYFFVEKDEMHSLLAYLGEAQKIQGSELLKI